MLAVSDKTRLPGAAAQRLVTGNLAGGDFYDIVVPEDQWTQVVGPIKAMAWPVLLQTAGLAQAKGGKLALTPTGLKAMQRAPADVLRDIWRTWLTSSLLDEFSRLDEIKGHKSKGLGMSPTAPRRALIGDSLRRCPVDTWVEVDELLRFMQAEGHQLELCDNIGALYIEDPQYGSLMFGGSEIWHALQLRYMLCVLFEYCATLGMVDVAFGSPHDARFDYDDLWGADEMSFLSRYDGLTYIRLTGLGAYCLGLVAAYVPPARATSCTLSIQADLLVSVSSGTLAPEDVLLLENWATRETDLQWRLDRQKAIAAVERGHGTAQIADFLAARDNQPLPSQVEHFLRTYERQGKAMTVLAASLLIECVDAATADLIAAHKDCIGLCMRAGKQHLVVREDREGAFLKAVHQIGFGVVQGVTAHK